MNNPGYGQNPFANPPPPPRQQQQQQQQPYSLPPSSYPQSNYGEREALNDPYASQNSSTTRLAGSPGYYDHWPRLQPSICFLRRLSF
ncbi:hypothetical protein GYMLUDRAFT_666932 [Collybiopsis luxurians FD-317 M1]|uniref:Uncharacterized protein n=1 Tax=Collybiopsis luxurians FD-317 M1 TaxID=944289 RepID=A0A0D0BWE6_9AGAR|nr:hypothetical protein GYMLUDRAFT_666932 [Collybiopsis luxurians FD-317 M1]